jgi:hypothetical protein
VALQEEFSLQVSILPPHKTIEIRKDFKPYGCYPRGRFRKGTVAWRSDRREVMISQVSSGIVPKKERPLFGALGRPLLRPEGGPCQPGT